MKKGLSVLGRIFFLYMIYSVLVVLLLRKLSLLQDPSTGDWKIPIFWAVFGVILALGQLILPKSPLLLFGNGVLPENQYFWKKLTISASLFFLVMAFIFSAAILSLSSAEWVYFKVFVPLISLVAFSFAAPAWSGSNHAEER